MSEIPRAKNHVLVCSVFKYWVEVQNTSPYIKILFMTFLRKENPHNKVMLVDGSEWQLVNYQSVFVFQGSQLIQWRRRDEKLK